MHVVATAGHVDHGKSTLVRALTGMEPDRWAEERRRGLTIDLGFAWTQLPGVGHVAFVDVPGHERFVPNMLAGIGPVPAVMLVVAADEGWRRQTTEHVAALDALGVRHGLLVLTRSDLADPGMARAEALDRLARTSLRHVASVAVSARTGEGLDKLRAALQDLVAALPAPDLDAPVRLWVDRSFTVAGAGTVVTGTLPAGRIRLGDELLVPGAGTVRVRGLQSAGRSYDEVAAVARVAVNLRGVDPGALTRGDALVTAGAWTATDEVDVRTRGDSADELPAELVLHAGSAAVPVHVRPLGPGAARLRLARALPLHVGDSALLRDPGRHRVAAGVTVLDVRPPALTRRGAAAERARRLEALSGVPDAVDEIRRRGIVSAADLVAMGATAPAQPMAGGWYVDPRLRTELAERLRREVTAWRSTHPLEPGLPVAAARQRLDLPAAELVDVVRRSAGLEVHDGRIVDPAAPGALPARLASAVTTLLADLEHGPFSAPEAARLAELGLGPREVAAAERVGLLLRVADGVVLAAGADRRAAELLAGLEQPFTVSDARRALGTTRRVAVPLLELLDRRGLTERLPDDRRRVRASRSA